MILFTKKDPYPLLKEDAEKYFDTSNYPQPNQFGIPCCNKKVVGMMKDECGGQIIKSFIGVKEKVYAIEVIGEEGNITTKKAAGTSKNVVRNFTLNDYIMCVQDNEVKSSIDVRIQNKKHVLNTVKVNKISLSTSCNKRVLTDDFDSYAIGHYKIAKMLE